MRSCVSHSVGLSKIVQVCIVCSVSKVGCESDRFHSPIFQWHQCLDGAHLFEPQCWHLERVEHQPARRPFGRAPAEILNSSFSLSAEIPWTRLSSEPTVVTASEVWVELRCVPGDLKRWRRKAQEVTSAVEYQYNVGNTFSEYLFLVGTTNAHAVAWVGTGHVHRECKDLLVRDDLRVLEEVVLFVAPSDAAGQRQLVSKVPRCYSFRWMVVRLKMGRTLDLFVPSELRPPQVACNRFL